MRTIRSFWQIPSRLDAAGKIVAAVVLLACVTACAPPPTVTVDVPIALNPSATATANLPGPQNYGTRAARVRLRFADTPLHDRGSDSWTYTVNFTMTPLSNAAAAGPPQNSSLTIFRGADHESFEALALLTPLSGDGVEVRVTTVNATAGTPTDIKLNLELSGERTVAFARTQQPTLRRGSGPTPLVTMDSIPEGTVSYEFEWVFYDGWETQSQAPFDSRAGVRIATDTPFAFIDTSYPEGTLYVRGRAIGRFAAGSADGPARRPGRWSNALRIPISANALEPAANWRYGAAYAEGAGFAANAEFLDGAYRSRQQQTRDLMRDARVITETKYDREGRARVKFLPAPAAGSRFDHADVFNAVDAAGAARPYAADQFDGVLPVAASAANGAGKYYSPSSGAGPLDAYVADAGGYPFSAVEPTRDGTNRPQRVGGLGEALRLGGEHDQQLRYGTTSSSPLRRLFGRNVGRAAYYDRNVAVDANRQAHVNYVDRSGRVVASALIGSAPNLESVAPSNLPMLTYRLDENNVVDAQAGISRSVSRISIEQGTELFFSYDLNGAQYSVPASAPFPRLCESCRYRLRVRLTDPNGNRVTLREATTPQMDPLCTSGTEVLEIAKDLGDTAPSSSFCAAGATHPAVTAASPNQTQVKFCAKLTDPGDYEVVKELTLIEGAVESVVTKVTTLAPEFVDVGTYRPDVTVIGNQCPGPKDCSKFCGSVGGDFEQQCLQACTQPLNWVGAEVARDSCKSLEQMIRADIAAPRGILRGTPLTDHPEYCHIYKASTVTPSLCERSIASNEFDYRMMMVNTWNEALCRGYLDPLGGTPGAPARPATCTAVQERDPFTAPTQIGVTMRSWMEATLQDYTGRMPAFSNAPKPINESIWNFAAHPIYPSTTPPSDDERWRVFRSLYMGVKQTALVLYMEDPKGGNCPYWNDKHAHVKRPYTFSKLTDATGAARNDQTSYCATQCTARAAQWTGDLEDACGTTIPDFYKSTRLAPNLRRYCIDTCSATNPLPVITSGAVTTNQWFIQAMQGTPQYAPPATCTLNRITRTLPAGQQGPISIGNYTPAVGDTPQSVTAGVVAQGYEFPPRPPGDMCRAGANEWADQLAWIRLENARTELQTSIERRHYSNCFGPELKEAFSYQARQGEYHFTLHYYDQAGNRVQTVPPAGVHPLSDLDLTRLESGTASPDPQHKLLAEYRYNSLDQLTMQKTPDGGQKNFWYNAQGQLRLSQSPQQAIENRHAYVKYDDRGRIEETGVVTIVPSPTPLAIQQLADERGFPQQGLYAIEQVVKTTYDRAVPECQMLAARNLRGRIAAIVADSSLGSITTCYSYDPHGNVTTLAQTIPGLGTKTVKYEYDILDGKVLATAFQAGAADAIQHRYTYDLDRRLISVETSRDGELWERDATYAYYSHGPTARIELGADRVQGLDYLYAITGWPKGINSDTLAADRDPGRDGQPAATNIAVARDVFGSAVHYFPNDYRPVAAASLGSHLPQAATMAANAPSALTNAACSTSGSCGLYDGNVTGTASVIAAPGQPAATTLGMAYRYDQLFRLRTSTTFTDLDVAGNRWPQVSTDPKAWRTATLYDPNGNITSLQRYVPGIQGAATLMDDLVYEYPRDVAGDLTSNRLSRVIDQIDAGAYPEDFDTQPPDNYAYDANGRPTRDVGAGLNAIGWNVASRVTTIDRIDDTLEFVYDGLGNRVAKVIRAGNDRTTWKYEYFVRDVKGKLIASYKSQPTNPGTPPDVALLDHVILGVGRLGTWAANTTPMLGVVAAPPAGTITPPPGSGLTSAISVKRYTRVRGDKQYELANYLGNVEATIKDRKTPVEVDGAVTHYEAQLVNSSSYYPFGSLMPGRGLQTRSYRYGFSGLERDDELKGAGNSYYTDARLYDPRVGRWLSPDPIDVAQSSPFVGFANNPVRYSDPKGTAEKDTTSFMWGFAYGVLSGNVPLVGPFIPSIDKDNANFEVGRGLGLTTAGVQQLWKAAAEGGIGIGFIGGSLATGPAAPAAAGAGVVLEVDAAVSAVTGVLDISIGLDVYAKAQAQGGGCKDCPNPYGRKGSPEHQEGVDKAAKELERKYAKDPDIEVQREVRVKTPKGEKESRYIDTAAVNTKTGKIPEGTNVGRETQAGKPVAREQRALDDIGEASPDTKMNYKGYKKNTAK